MAECKFNYQRKNYFKNNSHYVLPAKPNGSAPMAYDSEQSEAFNLMLKY
jgi:hypothetical protein